MKTYKVQVSEDKTEWFDYETEKNHREDGPAVEQIDGTKYWYLNDKLHREDGPAVEFADGYKAWFINGQRHREDGPAREWTDGYKEWYINGEELTEEEFKARTNSCAGKVVQIEGIKYKLTLV